MTSWDHARRIAHAAGLAVPLVPAATDLASCDERVLAEDVRALVDLPPFDSSRVDGYAVRGPGPWTLGGTAVRIATGGMVPAGTEAILRAEETATGADGRIDGRIDGRPRSRREWRAQGEQAQVGDLLVPAGSTLTPAAIGAAAAAGHDQLSVYPRPRIRMVLLGADRIRDALGPQMPLWARRLGLESGPVVGPVQDTVAALRAALDQAIATGAELVATIGGNTYGAVSNLRHVFADLRADYLIDTVRVRPGKAMLLARIARPDGTGVLLVGMPASPQPAILALLTLVVPAYAGMTGRALPELPAVTLGAPIPGRGAETRLVPARLDENGHAHPVEQELTEATGFAVIGPGTEGAAGERVPFLRLPITAA